MLNDAVIENNVATVKFLIENGTIVLPGEHPLHIAVANDNCEMVEVLLPLCDIGDLDGDRRTPLHLVRSRKMAILLLRHGARADVRDAQFACPYETTPDESARKLLLHRYCELHPENKIAELERVNAMNPPDYVKYRFSVGEIKMDDLFQVGCDGDPEEAGIVVNDCQYWLTKRFFSSFARRMGFATSFYRYFSPLEVLNRVAKLNPDMTFQATFDNEDLKLLGVTEPHRQFLPAHIICKAISDDPQIENIYHNDGIFEAKMLLDDKFEVPFAGEYRCMLLLKIPVDGVGSPCMYLASIREASGNVSVAMSKQFCTDLEVNDESGASLRKQLKSFNAERCFSALIERLIVAQRTPASVSELLSIDELISANVTDRSAYRKIHDRLNDIAGNPCSAYKVPFLEFIECYESEKNTPVACSINDLLNFCSELTTHHYELISNPSAFHEKTGEILGNCFDLEEMHFQQDKKMPDFFLEDLDLKADRKDVYQDIIYESPLDPGVRNFLTPERNFWEEGLNQL